VNAYPPRDRLGVPETPEERAWMIWCERGVIVPEFASEIVQRRRILRQWAAAKGKTADDQ
jgi:hypothetical protein